MGGSKKFKIFAASEILTRDKNLKVLFHSLSVEKEAKNDSKCDSGFKKVAIDCFLRMRKTGKNLVLITNFLPC